MWSKVRGHRGRWGRSYSGILNGSICSGSGSVSSPASPSTFKIGLKTGWKNIQCLTRTLKCVVSQPIFPKYLEDSHDKIFDPQHKQLHHWNKIFLISCIIAIAVDPLFFYTPFISPKNCLGIDRYPLFTVTPLRNVLDVFYVIHIFFQFHTPYVDSTFVVSGRGELETDRARIASRYLRGLFIVDVISILPAPQVAIWTHLYQHTDILKALQALFFIVFLQYIPRFYRMYHLNSELERTVGALSKSAFWGAVYYLLCFIFSSHIIGATWYLLAAVRNYQCLKRACIESQICNVKYLYCDYLYKEGSSSWSNISETVLQKCSARSENPPVKLGIYKQALDPDLVTNMDLWSVCFYCFWWGFQNLSTLGQGLQTTTYPGEVLFSVSLSILGLILFALLISKMQAYLLSGTLRVEEMRIKKRDLDKWMHHRLLPDELRERVERYDRYKWLESQGVDEESLLQSLPKDLKRDIKRHLFLPSVRMVPVFTTMDERILDAICERLKPSLYTQSVYILREGDSVTEMLFIIRGELESVTTDGGRIGFFNQCQLTRGDFCGEELLSWALDCNRGPNLPLSTRTLKTKKEVEALALSAEDLKFVVCQFRHLHTREVQHAIRFYSQQWRTWAACYIQAAWFRYKKKKSRREQKTGSLSFTATIYASQFATNALRRICRLRKPQEHDLTSYDAE